MSRTPRDRLSRGAWVTAALALLAEGGGLHAVAVEPLAKRLGSTKGSFYWHFADRDELVTALLATWRDQHTEQIILDAAAEPDPALRLHGLFRRVMTSAAGADASVELSLLASTDRPEVAAALREVTERRIAYVADCYEQLGSTSERARHAAVLAYTAFAGLLHAQHATRGHLLDGLDRADYLRFAEQALAMAPIPPGQGGPERTRARSRATRG